MSDAFSIHELTRIPFELSGSVYRSPMPYGPFDPDERIFQAFIDQKINTIIMLVQQQEAIYKAHRDLITLYQTFGFNVIHFPIQDFETPHNVQHFSETVDLAIEKARNGENLVMHCNAGLGRTGLFATAMALSLYGYSPQQAIRWVRQYIPAALENPQQESFISAFQSYNLNKSGYNKS
jgi:protein-tyrosine phosphatase